LQGRKFAVAQISSIAPWAFGREVRAFQLVSAEVLQRGTFLGGLAEAVPTGTSAFREGG
jgi:hypothetical protein